MLGLGIGNGTWIEAIINGNPVLTATIIIDNGTTDNIIIDNGTTSLIIADDGSQN